MNGSRMMSERLRRLRRVLEDASGFTLLELLIAVALLGVLAAMLIPTFLSYLHETKVRRAITDIRLIERDISLYMDAKADIPDSLEDLPSPIIPRDPWGQPYEYYPFKDNGYKGKARHNLSEVPINTDYDLYSIGRDGDTHKQVHKAPDDIIRAHDGDFVGLAKDYAN